MNKANPTSYRTVEMLLFLTLLIAFGYFLPRWADWSQNSRLDFVLAVVDDGTLNIDKYHENTGDYAKFEGHYYMDKAPGPALMGIPVYIAIRPILQSGAVQNILERVASNPAFADTLNPEGTGLATQKVYQAVVQYVISFVVSVIPSAFLGVLLFRFFTALGVKAGWSAAAALVYGLATPAFPYAATFYSHQLTAFLLFAAFYIGFQIQRGLLSPRWAALAGFMLGYSVISEYPTFLIGTGVGLYILYVLIKLKPSRSIYGIAGLIIGGVIPIIFTAYYNLTIFHSPLPVSYEYSELYTDLHNVGFLSLTFPQIGTLWGVTFSSYRGLFFVAPILLLGIPGFRVWWQLRQRRLEWAVCVWATSIFLLFNASSAMWEGGWSIGPRYVIPMLPFFAAGLVMFAHTWGNKLWARIVMVILTIWSFAVVWIETIGGQQFPGWDTNPLINYSLPNVLANDIARNLGMVISLRGIASLIALLIILVLLIALLFRKLSALPVQESPIAISAIQATEKTS